MTQEERRAMLKIDLGISTTVYDERLLQYIQTAEITSCHTIVKNAKAFL